MQYLILIYGDEQKWLEATPEEGQKVYEQHTKYGRDLAEAGVLRAGAELRPTSTAKTLRYQNGKVMTTDGPFAETREQLGGYYLIEVNSQEEAERWAARCPGVYGGSVELRATTDQAAASQG